MARPRNPVRGEQCHTAKLTVHDVKLIRALAEEREKHKRAAKALTNDAIAEKFEIHRNTVDAILRRITWIHA